MSTMPGSSGTKLLRIRSLEFKQISSFSASDVGITLAEHTAL